MELQRGVGNIIKSADPLSLDKFVRRVKTSAPSLFPSPRGAPLNGTSRVLSVILQIGDVRPLEQAFPHAVDVLQPDLGHKDGPKPIIFMSHSLS